MILEVFRDSSFCISNLELLSDWIDRKVQIANNVGSFVAPVGDDGLADELKSCALLFLRGTSITHPDISNLLKTSCSWHELENIIND